MNVTLIFRMEYLSKFSPAATHQHTASVGSALTQRFAARMVMFFVRHASLLKPLTQAGKLQLAKVNLPEASQAFDHSIRCVVHSYIFT